MTKPHDPKCRELAEYFLPDFASERLKSRLARDIQEAVDDWFLTYGIDLKNEEDDHNAREI